MTFILPTDLDYLLAKKIKHEASRLDPTYDRFVEQFHTRYDIAPLTISLDVIDRPRRGGTTPRLAVVLERSLLYRSFLTSPFNYDKTKQTQIASAKTLP